MAYLVLYGIGILLVVGVIVLALRSGNSSQQDEDKD